MMTRFLILLTAAFMCAGCATAPTPTVERPRQQISKQQADRAAQREVEVLRSAAPQESPSSTGGGAGKQQAMVEHRHLAAHGVGGPAPVQAAPGVPPPPPPPQAEDPLQAEVSSWVQGLSEGKIQPHIPPTMFWKESSTVTVVIQGPKAPASAGSAQAAGGGTLKVSNWMKVKLSSPADPDEFDIEDANGSTDVQFVPEDGSTPWTWTVTPKYSGAGQSLQVSAWLLYPNGKDILLALPAYTATVNVNVPGFGDALKRLIEGDPQYWLRYGLPGGGGFVFIAGIVTWFFKRKQKAKSAAKVS